MTIAKIKLPPKLIPIFAGKARYRCAYGGRGSAKTRTFALMTAIKAYQFCEEGRSGVILCGREFMNSLEDSSMEEIKQAIRSVDWLNDYFDIGEKYIRTKCRKINYVFCGLRHNLDSIKSKARVLLAWVDEAENVSDVAWRKLKPTVRESGSEIWVTWNPEDKDSPTNKLFIQKPPSRCKITEMNYTDNPWFPPELEQERLDDRARMDDALYAHVWEGAYLENSDAQIFKGKFEIAEFDVTPAFGMPFNGLDFGFSQDPTAATQCYVHDQTLYVAYECGKVGLDIDDTADYIDAHISNFVDRVVTADCARPESISYLRKADPYGKRKHMPKIEPCVKWKGSVEDGITIMKGFKKIVIHPRCRETAKEFRKYSYKVDQHGRVTSDIVDAYNHYIDSIRYGIGILINRKGKGATVI